MKLLPLETLKEAQNLLHRFQEEESFRLYVFERMRLVIPACLVIILNSIVYTSATVVFLAGANPFLTLPALLLVPVILIGSLFVQGYAFFCWLENRALERALGRRVKPAEGTLAAWLAKKSGKDLGPFPPVPWVLTGVFLLAPLAMLAYFALKVALGLIALTILVPVLYALFDR